MKIFEFLKNFPVNQSGVDQLSIDQLTQLTNCALTNCQLTSCQLTNCPLTNYPRPIGPKKVSLFGVILNLYSLFIFIGVVNAISRAGKSKAIYYHDLYRSKLARGLVKNKNGTYLPKGKNIYAMVKWFLKIIQINVKFY